MARVAPSRRSRETNTRHASGPRSRASRSYTVPPRMIASRADGGKAGGAPLAHARVDGGAEQRRLPGEVLGAALDQPRPADVAREAPRAPGRRQAFVVGGEHDLRVQALGRAAQGRERVLTRGAPVRVLVVEDVELRGHRPAGQVAPSGGCRGQPGAGEERVRGREPAGGGVDDHRDAARRVVEAILEPQAQVLEPVERPLGAGVVRRFVPGGEAQRFGLDPRHRTRLFPRTRRPTGCRASGCVRHLTLRARCTEDAWPAASDDRSSA